MPSRHDVEHLLRRTEYVARPSRIATLLDMGSLEDCVDDILAVQADPPSVEFVASGDWERGIELTHFWLDRMAHDSPRPIQEKIAFFWHGHFCSSRAKVGSNGLMREQIDLFRQHGLANFRRLAIDMSTQVAMLRYLDNNQNRASSPNQNFARELMELFVLGVGNYVEADVEAATAAWTGHTDRWDTDEYVWRSDWHDASAKSFLGRQINVAGPAQLHGAETIDVMLGAGVVPSDAPSVEQRGRETRAVAAEFIVGKLWTEFAGTSIPSSVSRALRDVALANDFEITPVVRALLLRPEFYADDVRRGRVRTPVEFVVGCLVATGLRSAEATPVWLMDGMGQRPLFPPNVAGWKHNGAWVDATSMAYRTSTARSIVWAAMRGFWHGDELVHLANGTLSKDEIFVTYRDRPEDLVDRILELTGIALTGGSREALVAMSRSAPYWERADVLPLVLLSPEFHLA